MAKKKKNVVIVDEELTPTVLATIEDKKGNIFVVVFLFIIFGAAIYFFPDINEYIKTLTNPDIKTTRPAETKPTTPTGEEKEPVEVKKYPYSDETNIDMDKFSLTDFSIEGNSLSLKINNNQNILLNMDTYNYYLEIYSKDETLLQRIKFDNISVGSNASYDLKYDLDSNNVAYFKFVEISKDEYPAAVVPADNEGIGSLTCKKDYERVNYLFKDNKLTTIEDYVEVNNSDEAYSTLLTTYQSLSSTYDALNGVNSAVSIDEEKFVFSTFIDLSVNNSVIINKIVYPKDTDAKVIKFEMNARGYTCD